ncbi:MAG TPA: hypothetical protein PLB78_10360, partial [Anaerolineae bacterium]|nr:hypothetical protein [Anaerolineae bacterium]
MCKAVDLSMCIERSTAL